MARNFRGEEKKGSCRLPGYFPGISPLKPIVLDYVLNGEKNHDPIIDFKIGNLKASSIIDQYGMAKEATMQIGPLTISVNRVFKNGTP